MGDQDNPKTFYEKLKQGWQNNRIIASFVFLAVVFLAILSYINELKTVVNEIWEPKGKVQFSTPYEILNSRGTVEIAKNQERIKVVQFNEFFDLSIGEYEAQVHIDNRTILPRPFSLLEEQEKIVSFDDTFSVIGIVVNGNGKPIRGVNVSIGNKTARTKNDGIFVLEHLPMQRKYDLIAYEGESNMTFTKSNPWEGTVYNGNWDLEVRYNIDYVE